MNSAREVLENGVVHIQGGKIVSLASDPAFLLPEGATGIDAEGGIILPGFINGHAHSGMTLYRGIADDLPLERWLGERIFPWERKWSGPEVVYCAVLLACAEMIRAGITTCNDMYYQIESGMRAFHEAGVRAVCGKNIIEISGVERGEELAEEIDSYLSLLSSYPLISGALMPHSVYGVSEKTWRALVNYAGLHDLPIHTHLSETEHEVETCRTQYQRTPTEALEDFGVWTIPASVAHGVWLTPHDIAILARRRVGVIHNPESNLKLGTSICPVVELRNEGIAVGLGTDGVASNNNLDVLAEASLAARLQSLRHGAGALKTEDVVGLLTCEGARALGLQDRIGSLESGKAADMIVLDTRRPHATPLSNVYSHLTYSAAAADVRHSIINGTVVLRDYVIQTIDEPALLREATAWGKRINS